MDILERIKKFCFKIFEKIEDRLASFVACVIIIIGSTLCIIFWEWLKIKHSLEMYGWMWLLILAVSLLACVYSLYVISKNFWRINDPKDIINVLSKWWRHCKGQNLQQSEFTLYFSSIDDKEKLKKGSAKKYLREIVSKDELWSVVREGSKTLTVKRKGYTLRVGSDPLSM